MRICDGSARGVGLEPDAEPAVGLVLAAVALGGDGVGKDEEPGRVSALGVEPLAQQAELVIEHRVRALLADVALARPVDGVAERHVVGRHRLGDRAGRAADAEEPSGHFLPGADLGERAVETRVEVDLRAF